jgi:photosystem II stability/assembly factor-like uncharacterized protein
MTRSTADRRRFRFVGIPGWLTVTALLLSALPLLAADKWELQYEHLDKEFDLRLVDVAFVDTKRGIAIGYIDSRTRDRQRAVNLVTSDGENWTLFEVRRQCVDVHALPSGLLYAACDDGIYRSQEMGRDWRRVARLRDIEAIWFNDDQHGIAVGAEAGLYRTTDGGNNWQEIQTEPPISTTKEFTVLKHVSFIGDKIGFATGWSRPPRNRDRIPDWLVPDRAMSQRDTPHVNVFLDTSDGGITWRNQEISMFGEVVVTELGPDRTGLTLVNFSNGFEYPAELYFFSWPQGELTRVFREKNRAVTDVSVPDQGPVYLVAVQPVGQLFWSPIPGRLRISRSADFETWEDMEVDYRATGRRARIEAVNADNVWVVTDTGFVLKLKRDGSELPERKLPQQKPAARKESPVAAPANGDNN